MGAGPDEAGVDAREPENEELNTREGAQRQTGDEISQHTCGTDERTKRRHEAIRKEQEMRIQTSKEE